MNDQTQAKQLLEAGKRHIESIAWDDLRVVNDRLWDLLPNDQKESDDRYHYTGIIG